MAAFYTDTVALAKAFKLALRQYAKTSAGQKLEKIKSWNLGFVFPETVHPALTIFPLSKTFLPLRSGGLQAVEYRYSVDVYQKHVKADIAKAFCFDIIDGVKKATKRSIQMVAKNGEAQTYATAVEQQTIFESKALTRGFLSTASLVVKLTAYHQMNINKVRESTILDVDYDTFFDSVVDYVKRESVAEDFGVKSWAVKTPKTIKRTPAVFILPGNEYVREEHTNKYVDLVRPITLHIVSRGYPKFSVVEQNMRLADNLVTAIEKNYMLGGRAQECTIQSIVYESPRQDGFNFSATIDVEYISRSKFATEY